jgi:iron complex transport system substrate-binding protein
MIKRIIAYSFILVQIWACNTSNRTKLGNELHNSEAKGFEIYETGNGYNLYVKDPFQGSDGNVYQYQLSRSKIDDHIKIPVDNVVCLSTSHIAFIDALGMSECITGISGGGLVYNSKIKDKVFNGKILDLGYGDYLNAEALISLNPDVVFAYGIDRKSLLPLEKLNAVGIPVILVGEYLENTPLGRLEWIRFFSCFFDIHDNSNLFYDSVSINYNNLRKIALECNQKPNVLVGLPWQGTWFVPGGDSFLSNMINDACGNFIFNDNYSHESIPLSIEQVFSKANNIGMWIHLNSCSSKKDIIDSDKRFKLFKPTENAILYNNNNKINNEGGNDYWESGVIHPDIVLKDLISIFHPDLFPNYQKVYYKQINE